MTGAIVTGLFGLTAVLVQTVLTLDLGARRLLKRVQDESNAVNVLPSTVPAETTQRLLDTLAKSVDEYAARRGPKAPITDAQRRQYTVRFGVGMSMWLVSVGLVGIVRVGSDKHPDPSWWIAWGYAVAIGVVGTLLVLWSLIPPTRETLRNMLVLDPIPPWRTFFKKRSASESEDDQPPPSST